MIPKEISLLLIDNSFHHAFRLRQNPSDKAYMQTFLNCRIYGLSIFNHSEELASLRVGLGMLVEPTIAQMRFLQSYSPYIHVKSIKVRPSFIGVDHHKAQAFVVVEVFVCHTRPPIVGYG